MDGNVDHLSLHIDRSEYFLAIGACFPRQSINARGNRSRRPVVSRFSLPFDGGNARTVAGYGYGSARIVPIGMDQTPCGGQHHRIGDLTGGYDCATVHQKRTATGDRQGGLRKVSSP
jgi:hypothetical protein